MSTTIKNLLIALSFVTLSLTACEKAPVDCTDLMADVSRAQTTYYNNPTTTNCEAYGDALQAYVNASCQDSGGFVDVIAQLPCK